MAQTFVATGPTGGDVRSLAADPSRPGRVYLGTGDSRVYRSDDSGRTWRRTEADLGLPGLSLDDLVVAPDGTLYVGYWEVSGPGGGVARSRDGGAHFERLKPIEGQPVRGLALAAADPKLLVASTLSGVFRSPDGGDSWQRISPEGHAELRNVGSVAIDPVRPDTIYAGTWHLPWKTTDGGRTWRPIAAGMIADSDVMTLTIDHSDRSRVFATACSGIYRSGNQAASWTKVRGIPSSSRRTRAFAQDPARPERFFAGTTEGLFVSDDGTASFTLVTSPKLVVNAVLSLAGGVLLLGVDGAGVLRSQDGGQHWDAANAGLYERALAHLSMAPGGRVAAAVANDRWHGGVLRSERAEGPWRATGPGLEGRDVLSLSSGGESLLAGTDDGLFLLDEAQKAWRRMDVLRDGLDAHPRITALAAIGNSVVLAATPEGLLRSGDGGRRFSRTVLGLAQEVTAVAANPQGAVVAATPFGLFLSTDQGLTFSPLGGLPGGSPLHTLAFLPSNSDVVFGLGSRGLYKSADLGRTWAPRGGGLPDSAIASLAFAPDGRTVVAADDGLGGLYVSRDAGDSWQPHSTPGLASRRIWTLLFEPGPSQRLLAAAPTGGLHVRLEAPSAASH